MSKNKKTKKEPPPVGSFFARCPETVLQNAPGCAIIANAAKRGATRFPINFFRRKKEKEMKVRFENAETLEKGIAFLCEDLGITLSDSDDADLIVTVTESPERVVSVTLDGNRAAIVYGDGKARFFRGLTILVDWVKRGRRQAELTERPLFRKNGAMADASSAVLRVETVKLMLRKMAMMGFCTFMLYTEDTYEIANRPYFGYLRGRYTRAELKELDAYALALGIELIPCIQVLGHLANHLHWDASAPYRDTSAELLVGAEETYRLIDEMLSTVSDCFTTRRVHIGMDETHNLGRGGYLDRNGYRDQADLYLEHLAKVKELIDAHGLEPIMWSDMFFRLAGKGLPGYNDYDLRVTFTDELRKKIPSGITQVYWDYYNTDGNFYGTNIERHRDLFGHSPIFAGGIWCWSGLCPLYSRSLGFTVPALDACRAHGVEEMIATIWGGLDHSLVLSLPGLAWYADYDYRGRWDPDSVKDCFARCCGASYDDLMLFELPEHPDGGRLSLSRALLYNDPLLGVADRHIEGLETRQYYTDLTARLRAVGNLGIFAPSCDTIVKLSDLLIQKADFGVRLKTAYDEKDADALRVLADECDVIRDKVQALRESHYRSFTTYTKPQDFELHDLRYGGILIRFGTTKRRIEDYLDGKIERIEELEEPRLRMDGQTDGNDVPRFHEWFLWMGYRDYATPRASL